MYTSKCSGAANESDFENLFHQSRRPLEGFTCRIVGNCTDAQDLVQETYLRARRAYDGLKGKESQAAFRTWLFRIARNVSIDLLRSSSKRSDFPLDEIQDVVCEASAINTKIAIEQALANLPVEYREPLVLCDLKDLPAREAAEVLEISMPALKSRLYRGRRALRGMLASTFSYPVKGSTDVPKPRKRKRTVSVTGVNAAA